MRYLPFGNHTPAKRKLIFSLVLGGSEKPLHDIFSHGLGNRRARHQYLDSPSLESVADSSAVGWPREFRRENRK